jgi:putative holliday junction resolvase
MAQIMAIDYGKVRTGIACTDDLQIIASPLCTVATPQLMAFLAKYFAENQVEAVVVGQPTDLKAQMSAIESDILPFIDKFKAQFPQITVHRLDERFTSKMASAVISQSGMGKIKRQNKGLIDQVSACIILQNFLDRP